MPYLIDTDIIINSIKGNTTVNQYIAKYAAIPKAISIITFGELLYGAKKSRQKDKNTSIIYRLAEIFPIVGITRSTIEAFTDIKLVLDRKGQRN